MQSNQKPSPEVVAAISAAVSMMGHRVIAVRIKPRDLWALQTRGGSR